MLILLPPSETKREGGGSDFFDVRRLRFPSLNVTRQRLVGELQSLALDEEASLRALKLSRRQLGEVNRNRELTVSGTMAAIDRYTGVLYDALDARSLPPEARAFAGQHLVIQSALLGPVGALDEIPAYRLSHDSRLPGVQLAKVWAPLAPHEIGADGQLVLDFRSEAYVALSPVADRGNSWFLRVVAESPDGQVRALNHFNKKSKGVLTRALLLHGRPLSTVDEVFAVARDAGLRVEPGEAGEIRMVV